MLIADIFHAEVINDEAEGEGAVFVDEESVGVFAFDEVVGDEDVVDEFLVGDGSRFWETVHAAGDAHVDKTIVDDLVEFVAFNDVVWEFFDWHAHVAGMVEFGVEIEVFEVKAEHFGAWGG